MLDADQPWNGTADEEAGLSEAGDCMMDIEVLKFSVHARSVLRDEVLCSCPQCVKGRKAIWNAVNPMDIEVLCSCPQCVARAEARADMLAEIEQTAGR
jgi:hypothetical protein